MQREEDHRFYGGGIYARPFTPLDPWSVVVGPDLWRQSVGCSDNCSLPHSCVCTQLSLRECFIILLSSSRAAILFVVEEETFNMYDQLAIEVDLWKRYYVLLHNSSDLLAIEVDLWKRYYVLLHNSSDLLAIEVNL